MKKLYCVIVMIGLVFGISLPAQAQLVPLSDAPQLSSNPSATTKIYLDFVGDDIPVWGSTTIGPGVVPAYDMDGKPATFNQMELKDIRTMWTRVADAFSPFNVDVTTINPGESHFTTAHDSVKVVIGGNHDWLRPMYGDGVYWVGGQSVIEGFQLGNGNATSFVFAGNLPDLLKLHPTIETPRHPVRALSLADGIVHEVGHTLGLQHQHSTDPFGGSYVNPSTGFPDPNGVLTDFKEYGYGTWRDTPDGNFEVLKLPFMGMAGGLLRNIWGVATTDYPPTQDDVAVIASDYNGFGFRPDDHGNAISAADLLTLSGNKIFGAGIIETLEDKDFFSFTTPGGLATINISPIGEWTYNNPADGYVSFEDWIGMLDAKAELFDALGNRIALEDHAYWWDHKNPTETISLNLPAGQYYLAVESQGTYGDLGQYTINGTLSSVPEPATLVLLLLGLAGVSMVKRRA